MAHPGAEAYRRLGLEELLHGVSTRYRGCRIDADGDQAEPDYRVGDQTGSSVAIRGEALHEDRHRDRRQGDGSHDEQQAGEEREVVTIAVDDPL